MMKPFWQPHHFTNQLETWDEDKSVPENEEEIRQTSDQSGALEAEHRGSRNPPHQGIDSLSWAARGTLGQKVLTLQVKCGMLRLLPKDVSGLTTELHPQAGSR